MARASNYLKIDEKDFKRVMNDLNSLENKAASKLVRKVFSPEMTALKAEVKKATPLSKRKSIVRKRAGKAGAPLRVRNKNPKTVHLRHSIVKKQRIKPSKGVYYFFIAAKKIAYWGLFIRKGTKERFTRKKHWFFGNYRGKITSKSDYVEDIAARRLPEISNKAFSSIKSHLGSISKS